MAGPEQFVGKWKQYQAENMEEFLKEMGANFMMRKVAKTANPEMSIVIKDGVMTFSTSAGFITRTNQVKLDGDSQSEDDGVMMDYTCKMEGNKLITTQEPVEKGKRKKVTVHREITDSGDLKQTMYIGDVICTRLFKKVD